MRNLTFTIYANKYAKQGEEQTLPWSQWVELLSHHEVRGHKDDTTSVNRLNAAKDGAALILGTMLPKEPRENAAVTKIDALALDIEDHSDESVREALRKLSGIEHLIYTTHRHGSDVAGGLDRLRVILPLSEYLLPEEYPKAWKAFNESVGGINDSQTKNIARLHYLPSTFDITKAGVRHSPGRWLSLDDLKTKTPSLLERVRRRLKAIKNTDPLADAARRLAKDQPFANEGTRHSTALLLTQWIGYRYQELSEQDLEQLFKKSLACMPDFPFGDVFRTYTDMVTKIGKQRQAMQARDSRYDYSDDDLQRVYDEHPDWSRKVLEQIVTKQSWDTLNEIRKRWIVQRDGVCWFLQKDGTYSPAISTKDVQLAISIHLGPTPVPTVTITEKGPKPVNRDLIFSRHAALASRVVADLTRQYTIYESETQTLREAVCPLRKCLKPVYGKQINSWLKRLAGENYEKILDWMATAPDLTQILCAIYFDGVSGSGKTLFAYGIARLWTDGPPAEIGEVIKGFNEELVRCPVVLADEEIPKDKYQDATAVLRSMLSTTSRSFKRKHRGPAELIGAVRLILAANNEFLLQPPSVTTRYDTLAIAERFLEIEAAPPARNYLKGIRKDERERWAQRGIAEHALWLQANHIIKSKGNRFVVEGNVGKMHRGLTTRTKWNALCYEWLVNYLMSDTEVPEIISGFVECMDGDLYVCNHALIHGWALHLRTREDPSTAKINAALRAISDDTKKQLRRRNKRYKYYRVDLDYLYAWAETEAVGDREAIEARIRRESLKAVEEDEIELPEAASKTSTQLEDVRGIFAALREKESFIKKS